MFMKSCSQAIKRSFPVAKSKLDILFFLAVLWGGAGATAGVTDEAPNAVSPAALTVTRRAAVSSANGEGPRKIQQSFVNALAEVVARQPGWQLVSRDLLPQLMKELLRHESGVLDPATKKELGKIQGLDYLIVGTIESYSSKRELEERWFKKPYYVTRTELAVSCQIVEVESAKVIAYNRYRAEGKDKTEDLATTAALASIATQFANSLRQLKTDRQTPLLQGNVTNVQPDKGLITINLGTAMGVKEGMIFEITSLTIEDQLDGTKLFIPQRIGYGMVKELILDSHAKLAPVKFDGVWKPDDKLFDAIKPVQATCKVKEYQAGTADKPTLTK